MKKILIIDDSEAIRLYIEKPLAEFGYIIEKASDGKVGIDVFKTFNPDLVITDIIMSGQEGIETIGRIRKELNSDVKIIAISSNSSYLGIAKNIGADFILEKPFDQHKILEHVNSLLENP